MRIGIDAHALGTGAGGNETFVLRLLQGLSEQDRVHDFVALAHAPELVPEGIERRRLRLRPSLLRTPFELPWAAAREGLDLLHVQYIAPPVCPCPFVVTLHDVVWRYFPETLPPVMRRRLEWLVPGTLRRAARVFVVSEAVRRQAVEEYGLPEERMDVVPNSVDPAFAPVRDPERLTALRERYHLPERYVAYLGALQPRKNVVRLAGAVKALADRGLPHALVLIGGGPWGANAVHRELDSLDLGGRLHRTGYADPADLPALLSAADAFAYISLYEGFGIPVLEAMACGTPVLISRDPALREVAGAAALDCDAQDDASVEEALHRLLTDEELREQLSRDGPKRAAGFTPRGTAEAALRGYSRIAI